jgi:hypothetical protein
MCATPAAATIPFQEYFAKTFKSTHRFISIPLFPCQTSQQHINLTKLIRQQFANVMAPLREIVVTARARGGLGFFSVEALWDGAVMWKDIRGQVLVWFGIVGTTLTIISQASKFITLSNWTASVAQRWTTILHNFWNTISTFLGKEGALGISALLFLASLAFGLILVEHRLNANIRKFYLAILIVLFIPISFAIATIVYFVALPIYEHQLQGYIEKLVTLALFIALFISIFSISEGSRKSKMFAALAYATTVMFFYYSIFTFCHAILRASGIPGVNSITGITGTTTFDIIFVIIFYIVFSFILLLPVIVSPTNELNKRLIYIWVGVAVIFGLSEASILAEKLRTAANPAAATQQH